MVQLGAETPPHIPSRVHGVAIGVIQPREEASKISIGYNLHNMSEKFVSVLILGSARLKQLFDFAFKFIYLLS